MLYEKSFCLRASLKDYHENVTIRFTANCGVFGTNEIVDEFYIKTSELLELLYKREDKGPAKACE